MDIVDKIISRDNWKQTIQMLLSQKQNIFSINIFSNNISIPKKVTYPYISYTLSPQLRNLKTDFTLDNCLFGSVKLT